jgi:hypothetical protein
VGEEVGGRKLGVGTLESGPLALPAAGQSEGRGAVSVGPVWFRLLMFSY